MKYELTLCLNACWCRVCRHRISKGEKYYLHYFKGWNAWAWTRVNICAFCINAFNKQIKPKMLKKIKRERALEKL